MKQGTMSVLAGCHSPVHSVVVIAAWRQLHGCWPSWWETVCIFLHDIGHWGTNYLNDYEEKKRHSILGARIAGRLFGQKGYDLIAGHNEYNNSSRSKLHDPDKYSWVIAPLWWMASNTIFEPKLIRRGCSRMQSARMFKDAMRENVANGCQEQGHEIYLRQWGHTQD